MKESIQNSADNLVMFPAAKNFPVETSSEQELINNDPLEALLNEFAHIPSQDEIYDEDELIEESAPVQKKLGQLERILLIHQQLKKLEDTTQRMKYLIDEIEDFLPKKVNR
ncbi:hypothetical protein BMS_1522 [Halobacteriovorax marinus SJ]|uniref:Uncharacterized protein n=1 Tax=Halobacteriovorax marinus (strain ATCC BAA-682 / DSM 15412 / SJ) TaxID=862908 RepID=E1X0P0_HALMS|nr:hypothetical protein [Halobacteriovorax marinus]CBW26378.1 hypothetical protein BMS_1522 [Halobacteriovorax marinus SJ]